MKRRGADENDIAAVERKIRRLEWGSRRKSVVEFARKGLQGFGRSEIPWDQDEHLNRAGIPGELFS